MSDQAELFRTLFEDNPMPMWLYDPETLRIVDANDSAARQYGWTREEFRAMTVEDIRPAEDLPRFRQALALAQNVPGYRQMRGWRHCRKDGSVLWVDVYSSEIQMEGRRLRIAMAHDITRMRETADRLEQQSLYFRQLFEASPEATVLLDPEDRIVDLNPAFTRLFGYTLGELEGICINDVLVPPDRAEEARLMTLAALASLTIQRETVRRRKDGSLVEVAVLGYPISIGGQRAGVFAIYRDVTESRRLAAQLAHQATHDVLTGLLNRHEFERQAQALLFASRGGERHSLIYLDIDQFKVVNESLGRDAGDRVMADMAQLLGAHLVDAQPHVLARIGGDKFAVLLRGRDVAVAEPLARALVSAMREQRFRVDGHSLSLGLSAGVAEIGGQAQSMAELLAAADAACLAAKERGRGSVHVFRPDDVELLQRRGILSWAAQISEAVEAGRFSLYFQRIIPVAASGQAPLRYEVLLRLPEEQGGIGLPSPFIAAAERYGLMPLVDRQVVRRVLERLAQQAGSGRPLPNLVSINVSGASISEEGFGAHLCEQIARVGLPARMFCFEITETSAIANLGRALSFLRQMREFGCSIALDDFGSGMSSFGYLKALAVDYLKIDGSFIRDMVNDPLDYAMVEAIHRVGQVRGIKTVAEYVENEATLQRLRDIGVTFAQGFHIHAPEAWDVALDWTAPPAHTMAANR